jgi:threonine/homoserine/homoserine lactone efflux protein
MSSQLLAYVGVCLLITVTPGIDTALVTRNVVARGRWAGIETSLGTSCGLCVHAVAVALGVSTIVLYSATLFTALKLGGAVYLGILGILALRGAWRGDAKSDVPGGSPTWRRDLAPLTRPYVQGLMTDLTNPKAVLFFLTFLPQFLVPGGNAVLTALSLAAIPVALNLVWLGFYSVAVGRIASVLRRLAVRRVQEGLLGAVFIGFGVRLAFEQR